MTFGTVCDGIGCGHLAFERAGYACAWMSEIDAVPSGVLAERFPGVRNIGNMKKAVGKVRRGYLEAPDVLTGGTPCQAFSVAGKREGMADERGNLSIWFCRIAEAIDAVRKRDGKRPCVVLWENVPGVLSDKRNAFGCFLGELSGAGRELFAPGGKWKPAGCVFGSVRTVAWRVLDSQFFGVAQRRARVFVVACAGDARPEEILFEREGERRDFAPRREEGEVASRYAGSGAQIGHWDGGDCHPSLCSGTKCTGGIASSNQELFSQRGSGLVPVRVPDVAGCLSGKPYADNDGQKNKLIVAMAHGQSNAEVTRDVSPTLNCNHEAPIVTYDMRGIGDGRTVNTLCTDHAARPSDHCPVVCGVAGSLAPALKGEGFDASEDGTGRGTPIVAFAQNQAGEVRAGDIAGTLNTNSNASGRNTPMVAGGMMVRRLTPLECERLQGLPDGWTRIRQRFYERRRVTKNRPEDMWEPSDGGWWLMAADSPRYKGVGNGQTVQVMEWLAGRIRACAEAGAAG